MKKIYDREYPMTMDEALQIQDAHLNEWALVLKPEVMEKLRALVKETNKNVTEEPWLVVRGDAITEFILNAKYHQLV